MVLIKNIKNEGLLFFLFLLFVTVVPVSAQSGIFLSASPLYSMPLGGSMKMYQYGLGVAKNGMDI